ncbi:MAG: hypothetical protein ACPHSF_07920, partial [Flavobacteriales bacterium]
TILHLPVLLLLRRLLNLPPLLTLAYLHHHLALSLLIAALSAEGKSTIHNIDQIDRGYQHIDDRLRALGANIVRV